MGSPDHEITEQSQLWKPMLPLQLLTASLPHSRAGAPSAPAPFRSKKVLVAGLWWGEPWESCPEIARTPTSQWLQNKGALGSFRYAGHSVMQSTTVTKVEDLE